MITEEDMQKTKERVLGGLKMIDVVGAPVGFCFDWVSTQAIGRFAIRYYRR